MKCITYQLWQCNAIWSWCFCWPQCTAIIVLVMLWAVAAMFDNKTDTSFALHTREYNMWRLVTKLFETWEATAGSQNSNKAENLAQGWTKNVKNSILCWEVEYVHLYSKTILWWTFFLSLNLSPFIKNLCFWSCSQSITVYAYIM